MSKSRGNVIDPDEEVAKYGADTVRAFLMFAYRWAEGGSWNADNIQGVIRWLNRVWTLCLETAAAEAPDGDPEDVRTLQRKVHQTIRHVSHDLESFEFNTVVSALMQLTNALYEAREAGIAGDDSYQEAIEMLLKMMAPITPHIAEELWARLGKPYSIHQQPWPDYDAEAAKEAEITLVVQVNGKVRDRLQVSADISEDRARALALASETVQRFMDGKPPQKVVYVPGRLVNIVV